MLPQCRLSLAIVAHYDLISLSMCELLLGGCDRQSEVDAEFTSSVSVWEG
jgi:hypothetical protein